MGTLQRLKPSIVTRLQGATDEYYPGMFIPSTLIIMMNEIKRGYMLLDCITWDLIFLVDTHH